MNSAHVCIQNDGQIQCARCLSSFATANTSLLKSWLSSPCAGVGNSYDKPINLTYNSVHIGRSNVHYSHCPYTFKGLVYCNNCGCYTQRRKVQRLARPCIPPTQWGLRNLAALREGRLPPKVTSWPCDAPLTDPAAVVQFSADEAATLARIDTAINTYRAQCSAKYTQYGF